MSHEWVNKTHLRPQTQAHTWLGTVSVFGPLFHHHHDLCEQVVGEMFSSEDEESLNDPIDVSALVEHIPDSVTDEKQLKKRRIQGHINHMPDDASADTAPAGAATLQQQKLIGNNRQHHVLYDVRFFVQPSQEADKIMIAAAKKFFTKAKEMDDSLVIYPWYKSSKWSKVKEPRSIPETMGAFKAYFHQANPRAAGRFVYMRVWLGHDEEPLMLQEDLSCCLKAQQFGLYQRSVQAENISVIGWLLYSTRDINCIALQRSLEKRFKDKFEVGCRYRMISLGRRGAVPKDQQVKAIHIECDSEIQFELKVALSKIYASAKNDDYPNGIRMRLVPEINSMISPDT
jgi:hypothetical protein